METTPGKRVQVLREAKGYTSLTAFCEFTGLKVGTISALEKDKSSPSLETLAKLIEAFPDVNLDWLVTGQGHMYKAGELKRASATQSNVPAEPTDRAEMPPTVERETLPPGDAPGHLKIVRLTYEELLAENADLHRQLKTTTGQVVDMLTEEVKRLRKPLTSSEAAGLRATVDQIASEKPAAIYVAPGFKQAVHRQLA